MHIFLDIDGVLNKESDWRKPFSLNRECVENFAFLFIGVEDIHIILSSSWRNGYTNTGVKSQSGTELEKVLAEYGLKIEDSTPVSNRSRQEEIEYYCRRHGITEYLVLDDDPSLFPRIDDLNIYFTDYKKGLTKEDVKKIKKKKWRMNHGN